MQQMVETECQRWGSQGINITYQIRENRTGYKAGALKEGLKLQQWTQSKAKKKKKKKK
jgi:beta-mannan synthase